FDAWMRGDLGAMPSAEQRGAGVFIGKGKCVTCHSGPFLSDQAFHNAGMIPEPVVVVILDQNDRGASAGLPQAISAPVTTTSRWSAGGGGRVPNAVDAKMLGAFKTPTLRCVSQRPSFMHTGQMQSLEEVVDFFARGGDDVHGYLGSNELEPLHLSDEEKS